MYEGIRLSPDEETAIWEWLNTKPSKSDGGEKPTPRLKEYRAKDLETLNATEKHKFEIAVLMAQTGAFTVREIRSYLGMKVMPIDFTK